MKRSPLKRKTSLKAKSPPRRKPPKPKAAKSRPGGRPSRKRSHYSAQAEDRREWKAEQLPQCQVCGRHERDAWPGLEVHEIERKSHAKEPHQRINYLLVCQPCHAGPLATMPHAEQLAYKQIHDPEHYDLAAWLRLGDPELRAPHRITPREVEDYARRIERPRQNPRQNR